MLTTASYKLKSTLGALLVLSGISTGLANDVTVGIVRILVNKDSLCVITPRETLDIGSINWREYIFLLNTHGPRVTGMDGYVETNENVLEIPTNRPLAKTDIPLFKFFSNRPTTLGLLHGSAGASGGSSQNIILVDTETGANTSVNMPDMVAPLWLNDQTPPAYARMTVDHYLGPRGLSLGYSPRISEAYSFSNGQYERDMKLADRLYLEKFKTTSLTKQDMIELQKDDLNAIDPDTGIRFLDYIYYGTKSGQTNAVQELLTRVSPSMRDATIEQIVQYLPQ